MNHQPHPVIKQEENTNTPAIEETNSYDRQKARAVTYYHSHRDEIIGKLASLNRSWQSKESTYRAFGMAGIEPTPSKSECEWTPLSPLTTRPRGRS
jgi:hypothetical protein